MKRQLQSVLASSRCPICAGSGRVTVYVLYPAPPLGVYTIACSPCHGTGELESAEEAERVRLERMSALACMEREIQKGRRMLGLSKGEFELDGGEFVVAGVRM